MSLSSISECGKFIARATQGTPEVTIFNIEEDNPKEINKYDVTQVIKEHIIQEIPRKSLQDAWGGIVIQEIIWEKIVPGSRSTKLGVLIDNLSTIIILHVRREIEPIIIHQVITDGIETFEWIPPLLDDNWDSRDGAYQNSRQLVVYTKQYIQAKLYSLDCTVSLWTIDKPISKNVMVRPNSNNTVWSLAAQLTLPLSQEIAAIVISFYNKGSTSVVLSQFKLPYPPIDTQPTLKWSADGKWISNFSSEDGIFGFTLQVYNILGVSRRSKKVPYEIPTGSPLISMRWMESGITGSSTRGAISFSYLEYLHDWLKVKSQQKYFLLVVGIPSYVNEPFETHILSLGTLKLIHRDVMPRSFKTFWQQTVKSNESGINYTRSFNKNAPLKEKCKVKHMITANNISSNYLLLQINNYIMLYEIKLDRHISAEKDGASFDFICLIEMTSSLNKVEFMGKDDDLLSLVIYAEDHIAVYSIMSNSFEVIYQDSNVSSILCKAFEDEDSVRFIIYSQGNSRPPLLTIKNYEFEESNASYLNNLEDDSNLSIMKKFEYNEDNSKVVSLMRDVQHNEWGRQQKRARRFKFNLGRPSLLSPQVEEITDTFNLQKRPKRQS